MDIIVQFRKYEQYFLIDIVINSDKIIPEFISNSSPLCVNTEGLRLEALQDCRYCNLYRGTTNILLRFVEITMRSI